MSALARRHLFFAASAAAATLVSAPAIRALVVLCLTDQTASHLLMVPLVSIVLVWHQRDRVFESTRTSAAGAAVAAAGLLLLLLASPFGPLAGATDVLSLRIAAMIVICLGAFLGLYGPTAFHRALFPLLFALFTIPLPGRIVDAATGVLKQGSAEMVAWLLTLVGTPFHREAFVFAMPTLTIEIADACSGIRSSIALVLTVLLAGYTFLEKPWTRVLLLLIALPITLLKNAIRIVVLSLLAMHVDPSFISGQLHHDGGIVFFGIALLILAPILGALRRLERPISYAHDYVKS